MSAVLIIAVILAAVLVLVISWSSSGEGAHTPAHIVQPAFSRAFGSLAQPPRLKVSSAYGYPTFDVMFRSKAEMESAAQLIAEFKRELNILFRGYGSRETRFDAELATSFTYPGYLEELAQASRQSDKLAGTDKPQS
jgi:hypothetical protein